MSTIFCDTLVLTIVTIQKISCTQVFLIKFYRQYLLPIGLLAGTIIGAGIFALPFVFSGVGMPWGVLYLFIAVIAFILTHLMYGDIILRTPGSHRFVGYANIYLGRLGYWFAIGATVVQMMFVLTIYVVLSASFTHILFPAASGIFPLLVFWVLSSMGIFFSLRRLAFVEFLVTWGIVAIVAFLFAYALPQLDLLRWNFSVPLAATAFLPLAAILFSLSGRVAIPSLVALAPSHVPRLRRVIVWGTFLPAIVYAIFVFGVLALSPVVSDDAVSGLLVALPHWLSLSIGVLGVLSLYSSYIVVGLDVKNILRFDLRLSSWLSGALVVVSPMILYAVGFQNFIQLVGLIGGIFLGVEGICIVLMWRCLPRPTHGASQLVSPSLLVSFFVIMVFVLAACSQIVKMW